MSLLNCLPKSKKTSIYECSNYLRIYENNIEKKIRRIWQIFGIFWSFAGEIRKMLERYSAKFTCILADINALLSITAIKQVQRFIGVFYVRRSGWMKQFPSPYPRLSAQKKHLYNTFIQASPSLYWYLQFTIIAIHSRIHHHFLIYGILFNFLKDWCEFLSLFFLQIKKFPQKLDYYIFFSNVVAVHILLSKIISLFIYPQRMHYLDISNFVVLIINAKNKRRKIMSNI